MVTKKRLFGRIAALSVATVLAASLAACSSSGGSNTDAKAGKNILIGMNSGLVPQFERYAKEFEKTHKGFTVTVKAVPDAQPDYIQQLVTQGLSKSLPDIIFNYDSLNQTLNSNHLLYDIKPWLDSGHDGLKGSGFIPAFLDQYKVGKTITGIPVSADTGIVTIHTALFEKYGVPVPTKDWTLDDMYASAKAITEKSGGKVFGIKTPVGDGSPVFTFYPVLKALGSNLYDPATKKFTFANEGGIEAWTKILAPYTDKFGSPYSLATNNTLLESGQVAMGVGSTAGVAGLREKIKDAWDILPMPKLNGKSTTGGGSYSLSISAKSDNKEGAYQFMAWFFSTKGGMTTAQPDGVIPATTDGIANGKWLTEAAPVPASFVATIKASVPNAILPNAIPDAVQPKVVPALQTAMQQVVLKGMSIKEAYTAAQDELNGLLK
ncbi:extracellular solute-binding protein [Lacisediminihabitans profunda]|uniref:extracellular solute-binding protein n=1 Tax=Lacisediminihabitans profunda TaxID=2594790 RepID=UPI00164F3530|nr:extracellular solute-binding protein [Lacisediminihabitans profunda]